jgi:hypothetical protein
MCLEVRLMWDPKLRQLEKYERELLLPLDESQTIVNSDEE